MKNKNQFSDLYASIFAILAALFYAINTPFSKILLKNIAPTFLAGLLYLGAGIGIGIIYLFHIKNEDKTERLTKQDLPYTIGMILLDIAAPIFLLIGINLGSASNASLLGNFEIVATTIIALVIFKEKVSGKLWAAIGLITLSSILLSFEGTDSFNFSTGSLFVILATCCWGLENNCTRKISDKSTYQIVMLKGIFSGTGSIIISLFLGEKIPASSYAAMAMGLGFVAYGLSIFMYVRAQRNLGAAKTSAYYAFAPFMGSILAVIVNGERLNAMYFISFGIMLAGTVFVVADTIIKKHEHEHIHEITHTHDGTTHTHVITHSHSHKHFSDSKNHTHKHEEYMNSEEHRLTHC